MASLPPFHIGFVLFPDVTQLDFTGPAQVLTRMGNTTIELVAKSLDPVMTDAGFTLQPTATFATARMPDILCVPGGFGVVPAMEDEETVAWVRAAGEQAQWVTAVCTGALLLGAAGLLKGYRATTHWASHHNLALFGAEPVRERYVFDRNRVTGGGVTAGIDFALALIAAIRGPDHAKFVQLSVEYDPQPPFDAGSPDKVEPAILERYKAMVARLAGDRDARTRAVAEKLSAS
jgi:cyclohexyl-isocyanide hydratase